MDALYILPDAVIFSDFNDFKQAFMKQILINSEELQTRVAVVKDGILQDFFMERSDRDSLVGSIYKARIKNLEPSLQAAFVDIGNAWEKSYRYDMSGINVGAGYGLRIKVPYLNAPVRLDLAYPILNNQDDVKNTLRFHFNMGFAF